MSEKRLRSDEPVLVEACVDSVASAMAAGRGGASRIELCDNLHDGGTTPSAGMIAAVKAAVRLPVFVLVRPRGGGFVYTDEEIAVMRLDIQAAKMLGVDGLVFGALTEGAEVDVARMQILVDEAGELPVTFHRAFDLVSDRERALDALRQLRVVRILTSGGASSAAEGADAIASLVRHAGDAIRVMAGGGVNEANIVQLVRRSGVREVHVRGTRVVDVPIAATRVLGLRKPFPQGESAWEETDESRVRELVRLANQAY